ncbi:MAG: type II toxin-antitoxin system VapC family toxin [Phyllobacteriaceae bacterium]|nr:type II toxin-antitoxin system VapC family toxin [Phyllobacteriaceae bacterium]
MVIDTSAIVAIARLEPEAAAFSGLLAATPDKIMAMPTYLESVFVLAGLAPNKGVPFLEGIVADAGIELVPFGRRELDLAIEARLRYGRGAGHKARLNFGDCFSYALAKSRNLPLLFKGDDFTHTDVEPALVVGKQA